jgi:hypothetical protein
MSCVEITILTIDGISVKCMMPFGYDVTEEEIVKYVRWITNRFFPERVSEIILKFNDNKVNIICYIIKERTLELYRGEV